ncbi:MAG: anti-sigma regulatory factor [Myxococcales bacterium]|nr:anti-sigma regulatory factor [Myxococcales bacterium]
MAITRIGVREHALEGLSDTGPLLRELHRGLDLFSVSPTARRLCQEQLDGLLGGKRAGAVGGAEIRVTIVDETHIVEARTRARALAVELGFGRTDQVKIATVVSELARNIYHYARTGQIRVIRSDAPRRGIVVEASDDGPGIADVELILSGSYRSRTGLGLGLIGCRNLMDEFAIDTAPGEGTRVRASMYR